MNNIFYRGIYWRGIHNYLVTIVLVLAFSSGSIALGGASTPTRSNITPNKAIALLDSSNKLSLKLLNSKDFTLETYDSLLPYSGRRIYSVEKNNLALKDDNLITAERRVITIGSTMYISIIEHEFLEMEKQIINELALEKSANYAKIDPKLVDPTYTTLIAIKSVRAQALDLWPEINLSFIDKSDFLTLKTTKSKIKGKTSVTHVLERRENALGGEVGYRAIYTIVDNLLVKIDEYSATSESPARTTLSQKATTIEPPLGPYLDWIKVMQDKRYIFEEGFWLSNLEK